MAIASKTARADDDLVDIWVSIAIDKPIAADKMLDTIAQTIHLLAMQPQMGRQRDELALGLRSFHVSRYTVFYWPTPDGIEVVRVMDSARDIPSLAQRGELLG